jgi:hypothetical protein
VLNTRNEMKGRQEAEHSSPWMSNIIVNGDREIDWRGMAVAKGVGICALG